MTKPFSQACENNKQPILEVLTRVFSNAKMILEIGSGTGQHAVYFSQHLGQAKWQPTDRAENINGIKQWCDEFTHPNLLKPMVFDINDKQWPMPGCDAVFSSNTAHIMSWPLTQLFVQRVAKHLPPQGTFALYGPFNYNGQYTSESNRDFDGWLKQGAPERGIRDFEAMDTVASRHGLGLAEDCELPANNRLLVWQKQ